MDLYSEIYDQIANTLSAHFECVYYVDINLLTKIKYLLVGFRLVNSEHSKQTGIYSGYGYRLYALYRLIYFHYSHVIYAQKLVKTCDFGLLLTFAFSFLFQNIVIYRTVFRCSVTFEDSHNLIACLT